MFRSSCLAIAAAFVFGSTPIADAQRNNAEIVQGLSSSQLTATVEELRVSNAELRARMTGLESDRAQLTGKVETLEFLLGQSRDQINRMQGDDAELQRLITRLEGRLAEQQATISELNGRLTALEPEPAFLAPDTSTVPQTQNAADAFADEFDDSVSVASAGPTRIIRRVEEGSETPAEVEAPTLETAEAQALPQGSLGTLPASALPGEAGPLFAEAKSRLLQFDYAGAEQAFRSFLTEFSGDPQAGEAQYWLAEVLYQQESYAESGAAYTDMIRTYPDDPRAPEALAKLARSMRLVGDTAQACNALNLLPQRYPNASGVTKNLAAGERVRSGCDS